eukprot:Skav220912  [mRNA]  locus=scaffold1145:70180:71304:+ [translate_table: standard]
MWFGGASPYFLRWHLLERYLLDGEHIQFMILFFLFCLDFILYIIYLLLIALVVVEAMLKKLRKRLWHYVNRLIEAFSARMEETNEKPLHGIEDKGAPPMIDELPQSCSEAERQTTFEDETQVSPEIMAETTCKAWEENLLSVSVQDLLIRTGQPWETNHTPALQQIGDDTKAPEEMMAATTRAPCEAMLFSVSLHDIMQRCESSALAQLSRLERPNDSERLKAASSSASPSAKPTGVEELKPFGLSVCSTQAPEEAMSENSDDTADFWTQIEENQLPLASENLSSKMHAEFSSHAKATGTTSHFYIGDTLNDEEADSCHPQVQELLDSFDIVASAERLLNYFHTAGDTELLEETGTSPLEFFIGDDDVPEISLP